jgi:hypothetical protein
MRLLAGLAAWSVLVVAISASLASQERAEERVVRVIPGPSSHAVAEVWLVRR